MPRRRLCVIIIGLASLSMLSCSSPYSSGVGNNSNNLKNMKPRALIATTAMHALLETHPEMEDGDLARRAFEVADAMITEAEKPSSKAQ